MGLLRNIAYVIVVLVLGTVVGGLYGALAAFLPGVTVEMMMSDVGYAISTFAGTVTVVYLHKQMK
jgi:hypothetical protein